VEHKAAEEFHGVEGQGAEAVATLIVLISRLLPGNKVLIVAYTWHGCHAVHVGVIVVQTEARG
jgi:hypothetical protein